MNETKFTKKFRARLKEAGCLTKKMSERFSSGFPDLIVIKEGNVCFIEIKAKGKKLTPLQNYTLKEIVEHGGLAYVVKFNKDSSFTMGQVIVERDGYTAYREVISSFIFKEKK